MGRMASTQSKLFATVAIALGLTLGWVSGPEVARAADGVEASEQRVAVVRVQLREADGSVARAPVRAIPFGDLATFEVRTDAHEHIVQVRPLAGGRVQVDYTRDGALVASDREVSLGARRSSVVHRDEGAQLSVSVTSTVVHVQTR